MSEFLNQLEINDIPKTRVIFTGLSMIFYYTILASLIFVNGFEWFILPLLLVSIFFYCIAIYIENIQMIKYGENSSLSKKKYSYLIVDFLIYWGVIFYLCIKSNVDNFTYTLFLLSLLFSIIKFIGTVLIMPTLLEALKFVKKTGEDYDTKRIPIDEITKSLEKQRTILKKDVVKSIIFAFIPGILGIIFLTWGLIRVIFILNISIELKLFICFSIMFSSILSNYSRILNKNLINKLMSQKL